MTEVSGAKQIIKKDISNPEVIYMGELRKDCVENDLEMAHEGRTEFKHKKSQAAFQPLNTIENRHSARLAWLSG